MEKVSRSRICFVLLVIAAFVFMTAGCEKKDLTKGTIEGYSYEETDEVTSYVKITSLAVPVWSTGSESKSCVCSSAA